MVLPDIYYHQLPVFLHHNTIKRECFLAMCCSCEHQPCIVLFVYISSAMWFPCHNCPLKLWHNLLCINLTHSETAICGMTLWTGWSLRSIC